MLTSKQRAYLRALASNMDTILIIGKDKVTHEVKAQARDALTARELIKCKVLETAGISTNEAAANIAESTRAEVVQVIGNKFVLYKRNEKNAKITLPKAKKVIK